MNCAAVQDPLILQREHGAGADRAGAGKRRDGARLPTGISRPSCRNGIDASGRSRRTLRNLRIAHGNGGKRQGAAIALREIRTRQRIARNAHTSGSAKERSALDFIQSVRSKRLRNRPFPVRRQIHEPETIRFQRVGKAGRAAFLHRHPGGVSQRSNLMTLLMPRILSYTRRYPLIGSFFSFL